MERKTLYLETCLTVSTIFLSHHPASKSKYLNDLQYLPLKNPHNPVHLCDLLKTYRQEDASCIQVKRTMNSLLKGWIIVCLRMKVPFNREHFQELLLQKAQTASWIIKCQYLAKDSRQSY